jgi:hypothetical protein
VLLGPNLPVGPVRLTAATTSFEPSKTGVATPGDAHGRLFTFEGDTRAARGGQARRGLSWSHDRVGGAASIDCSTEQIHGAGDHHIVVGRAHHLDLVGAEEPLLFFRGGYGSFAPLSLASGEADLYEQLRAVDLARPQMESLASCFDPGGHRDLAGPRRVGPRGVSGPDQARDRPDARRPAAAVHAAAWELLRRLGDTTRRDRWLARLAASHGWASDQLAEVPDLVRRRGYAIALGQQPGRSSRT